MKFNLIVYLFLLIIFVCNQISFSKENKPLSQLFYEDIHKMNCLDATYDELDYVKKNISCSKFNKESNYGLGFSSSLLDQISESLIFDTLIENQRTNLRCAEDKIDIYLDNNQLRNKLANSACNDFEVLRAFLLEKESVQDLIEKNKRLSDSLLRPIPKSEIQNYKSNIVILENRLKIVTSMVSNFRLSSTLFESQEIYEFVIKDLKSNKPLEKVCSNFKEKLPILLRDAKSKIQESLSALNSGKETRDLKEKVWQFASTQDGIIQLLSQNEKTKMGLFCRLEGRYGQGAKIRDKLTTFGLLAIPPALKLSETLAVATFAARSRIPFNVTKAILATELALGTSLNIDAIKKDCLEKYPTVFSGVNESCLLLNENQRKINILSIQSSNSCILSSVLATTGAYFSLGTADKVLKGLIPDSLMIQLGRTNTRLSELISHRGFYDAVEVISVKSEGVGKLVTIAKKPGEKEFTRQIKYSLNVPDPVWNPQILIDNLGDAASKFRMNTTNLTYQFPDGTLFSDRIRQYNAVAPNEQRIAVTFYSTKDEVQSARKYNSRFIEDGALPMGPAGAPGSTFTKTGHLHIHDVTVHGSSITIPQQIIENAKASYKIVSDFESYLKINNPKLFNQFSKKSGAGENVFELTQNEIARMIDFSTGTWTYFISNMRNQNIAAAKDNLWQQLNLFTGSRNMNNMIKNVSQFISEKPALKSEFDKYLKTRNVDLNKPFFANTEKLSDDDYVKFLYERQKNLVEWINGTSF